ncbi:MAG: hypothetical protein ACTHW1_04940, partial [Ancrocorticia sp.]|uniref:hypothetical protein n=1 Tax=Ancrocorticia sp. TaxID=2593684 RepID=UPI003F8EC7FC
MCATAMARWGSPATHGARRNIWQRTIGMHEMNVLILSAGTRCKTVEYFQRAAGTGRVITTDCSPLAPALYLADGYHVVPRIDDPGYL